MQNYCEDGECWTNLQWLWSAETNFGIVMMGRADVPYEAFWGFTIALPEPITINKAVLKLTASGTETSKDGYFEILGGGGPPIWPYNSGQYPQYYHDNDQEGYPGTPIVATSARVKWTIDYDWQSGIQYESPDIGCLIQYMVDLNYYDVFDNLMIRCRPDPERCITNGWSMGQYSSVAAGMEGEGPPGTAELHVWYDLVPTTTTPAP